MRATPRAHYSVPVILHECTCFVSFCLRLFFLEMGNVFTFVPDTRYGSTGARAGNFFARGGRGGIRSLECVICNTGSLLVEEKKGMDHRDDPTKRPYRRAGSPACTARVCCFSHRRTATTGSPPRHLPAPTLLLSVYRDPRNHPRHPRSTANERVLPRKSSPLNPT